MRNGQRFGPRRERKAREESSEEEVMRYKARSSINERLYACGGTKDTLEPIIRRVAHRSADGFGSAIAV
jgi:hypothetical protein